MEKVYHKLFYHAVWRTYRSLPLITPEIEDQLYPHIQTYIKKLKCTYFIANGIEDHIHVVLSIPPKFSISDIIGKIKGSSSQFILVKSESSPIIFIGRVDMEFYP